MEMPPDDGTEAWKFLSQQPKQEDGRVNGHLIIEESKRLGYCVCPRPMREVINFNGLTCKWCKLPETRQSYEFWYTPRKG